jgi:hypothetical protein
MLPVRDSEICAKIFQNLKSAAAHYYRQYYTGPSEHVLLLCGQRSGHPTETDQRHRVISLVTALTGNPAEYTHSKNRIYIASVLPVL